MVNGGRLFAKQLKKEGVEQIFTICGGQIMPLIYGCRAEGIHVVDVRHENAGVYAADAYARMTGKPGVIVATVTPGVMQTMQGIAEARGANSPVVLIAGAVGVSDFDSGAEQDFNAPAHVGIVAGSGAAAKQLLASVKEKMGCAERPEWIRRAQQLQEKCREEWEKGYCYPDITPMHPARCAAEVGKFLSEEGRDWSIAVDGGDAYEWIMRAVKVRRPGQIVGYASNGTIGTGQGFAMGAWYAHKKPVLLYTGDGSIGFYSMEFDTMERHGIPVICVVANDSQWGMVKMAEALNCYGELVTDVKEIIPAIRRAHESGKPAIINVEVDDEHPCPFTVMYGCGGTADFQKED